jgi:2-succinyl-6-hydroxy-2,4-cyclohexadiene-1-carboxylate synthase
MPTDSLNDPSPLLTVGDASRPGILFLHGFLGAGRDWMAISERLSERFHCMMADLPGHGENRNLPQPAQGAFHEAALALIEEIGKSHSGPLHLVGYSMGGRMALYLALRFPDLFTSATIISGSPGLRTAEERLQRQESDDMLAEELERDFDAFLDHWYRLPLFSTLKNDPAFPEILSARRTGDPHELSSALRALGTGNQPPLWNVLAGNRLPIMFCAGEKDSKFVEIGRQMVNLCPCSRLEIFENCGHTLHVENRALFLDRLISFINKHQPS